MANWLTNYVRPRIRSLRRKTETPDNLWQTCDGCGQMIHHKEFKAALAVCPSCGFHHRIGPRDRFEQLFDEAKYDLIDVPVAQDDPLKFRDKKKYADRLKDSRNSTGDRDALVSAVGAIDGQTTVVGVQNFSFMAGSLGIGAGDAFLAGVREAIARKAAYVIFTAAGGARMQEGILSLMQMPRTTVAVEMLRRAGLPYIVVLTDPTTGGVTASYAMLGDIAIAEPGALIGFAGPRVIEDTIREQLPEGFQRAEYLLEHGMIDMVVKRGDLRETLGRLLRLLGEKGMLATHPPARTTSNTSGSTSVAIK